MTHWLPDIIRAFQSHGGRAALSEVYRWIELHRPQLPKEYRAVIRATIYAHSSDCDTTYVRGNPDVFVRIERGLWGLRVPDAIISGRGIAEGELLMQAISRMTQEELESYSGRGKEMIARIRAEIEPKLRRLRLSDTLE